MLWYKLISRFQQGSAVRDVAILTMGTGVAQVVSIAVTPLLTRLYLPSDFGLLAVFLAVVNVGAIFVTLRYESSILLPKDNAQSANIVLLSLILATLLSLALMILTFFVPITIQQKVGLGSLGNWISISLLAVAATAVLTTMQGWMNRQRKYTEMAFLRIGQSSFLAMLAVFLGILNVDDGLLIAQILTNVCLCFIAIWLGRSVMRLSKKEQLKATALANINAPKFLLPTALLDVVTMQVPILMIALWLGVDQAGQFSMAWRLIMVPIALIGGAMGQVFMERLTNVVDTPGLAKKLFRQSWIFLFAIGLPPFALIFVGGDFIFEAVLGNKWFEAGTIAMMIAPMALAMFISVPTSGAYVILGLQKHGLLFGLAVFIYRPLCIYIGINSGDLGLGIKIWVALEIFQIFIYQMIAWKKIGCVK